MAFIDLFFKPKKEITKEEKARIKLKKYKSKLEGAKFNSKPLKEILYYEKKVDKWRKIFHKLSKTGDMLPQREKDEK